MHNGFGRAVAQCEDGARAGELWDWFDQVGIAARQRRQLARVVEVAVDRGVSAEALRSVGVPHLVAMRANLLHEARDPEDLLQRIAEMPREEFEAWLDGALAARGGWVAPIP